MFKEIKLPLNTSLLELATVSFFIAIGYSIIYKYFFYNELGIEWYVYSLSPNFIILSSIKIIFTLILSASLGIYIFMGVKSIGRVLFYMFIIIILMITLLLLNYAMDYIVFSSRVLFLCFIGMLLVGLSKYCMLGYDYTNNFKDEIDEKRHLHLERYYFLIYIVFVVFLILSVPATIGISEARDIKKNLHNLDRVLLKDHKLIWRMLELNNEKLLLVSKTTEKVLIFKIVEYKDVKIILANQN